MQNRRTGSIDAAAGGTAGIVAQVQRPHNGIARSIVGDHWRCSRIREDRARGCGRGSGEKPACESEKFQRLIDLTKINQVLPGSRRYEQAVRWLGMAKRNGLHVIVGCRIELSHVAAIDAVYVSVLTSNNHQ